MDNPCGDRSQQIVRSAKFDISDVSLDWIRDLLNTERKGRKILLPGAMIFELHILEAVLPTSLV